MACCGSQRASLRQQPPATIARSGGHRAAQAIELEYTGNGQLTVTGPLTGAVYRFVTHGHRLVVNGPDVASLVAIPHVKVVR